MNFRLRSNQHPSVPPRLPEKATPLIASFGRRRGRKLRLHAAERIEQVLPQLSLHLEDGRIKGLWPDLVATPLTLEIGFGGGEHLAAQALQHPGMRFIGCEPYVNGVSHLLKLLDTSLPFEGGGSGRGCMQNLRLLQDDVRELLPLLPEASIDKVFILFPDPWPKSRHHKRRLIQPDFLAALARVMKPESVLQLATDHEDYLSWMLEQLLQSPHFDWTASKASDWNTPPEGWVETKYQQKARAEGRGATFLAFKRL